MLLSCMLSSAQSLGPQHVPHATDELCALDRSLNQVEPSRTALVERTPLLAAHSPRTQAFGLANATASCGPHEPRS